MKNNKKQDKLKKKAEYQDELIKIINNTEIKFYREIDIPKTELGVTNKAKKLLNEYKNKLNKK